MTAPHNRNTFAPALTSALVVTTTTTTAGVSRSTSATCQAPHPERVQVYWNLNKCKQGEFVFSVRHKGKVIAYTDSVLLENCKFHVNPKQSAAIKGGQKRSVHAWVSGDLVYISPTTSDGRTWSGLSVDRRQSVAWKMPVKPVTYNPHRDSQFTDTATGQTVQESDQVWLVSQGEKGRVYYA